MNGFTNPTGFYHRPNICKCGHSYVVHTLGAGTTNNTCSLCVKQGGNNQRHYFAAKMETLPAQSFVNCGQYGYYNPGGFGYNLFLNIGNTGTVLTGTSFIPSTPAVLAQLRVGMTWVPIPNNFANQVPYTIIGINPTAINFNISPGLLFNIGASQVGLFYGSFGSTMGPGCTANNQRGG